MRRLFGIAKASATTTCQGGLFVSFVPIFHREQLESGLAAKRGVAVVGLVLLPRMLMHFVQLRLSEATQLIRFLNVKFLGYRWGDVAPRAAVKQQRLSCTLLILENLMPEFALFALPIPLILIDGKIAL